jgi:hypothetical protein
MYNKKLIAFSLFLVIAIGTFYRIADTGNIKFVQFISIFFIGVFAALVVNEFIGLSKKNR